MFIDIEQKKYVIVKKIIFHFEETLTWVFELPRKNSWEFPKNPKL